MKELFLEYGYLIEGLSLGTVALVVLSIAKFIKKDKWINPFLGQVRDKANKIFKKDNVDAFLLQAKDVKLTEIPAQVKLFMEKQVRVEKMLEVLLENQLTLGVYDNNPELKATVGELIEK